jgi:hypothetical protein
LSDRKQEKRVSPAGETFTVTALDGTRITLVFPTEALWRSEDVTVQIVDAVAELPFGAPLAVSISPDSVVLRRRPLLIIEPGRRSAFDGSRLVAGFSVRAGGELVLYPAGHHEIDRTPGRYRAVMTLTRLGTYGVANATIEQVRELGRHVPSELGARLEQRVALAYFGLGPEGGAPAAAWTVMPVVHAQGVSLFIYDLVKQLLDYYQQVVVPKFDKLPTNDCLSGATMDAISTYFQWARSVEMLFPVPKDDGLYQYEGYRESYDKVAAQRETMLRERGFTTEQIDDINRTIEQFREQFDRLEEQIQSRIRPALIAQFQAIYRCCTTQRPMQYHLTAMVKLLRFAELHGFAPVDSDPMQKVQECACLVGSNTIGGRERFTGTITYEESHSAEKTVTNSTRTQVNSESISFQQTSVLTFPRANGIMVDSVASGEKSQFVSTTDDHPGCTVHSESHLEVDGRDNDVGLVSINVNAQQGRYSLGFDRLPVDGSGRRRHVFNVKGAACGVFNKPRDETKPAYQGIGPLVTVKTVQGEIDPNDPYALKGSHTFELRDRFYDVTRTGTLTWDLQRCKR